MAIFAPISSMLHEDGVVLHSMTLPRGEINEEYLIFCNTKVSRLRCEIKKEYLIFCSTKVSRLRCEIKKEYLIFCSTKMSMLARGMKTMPQKSTVKQNLESNLVYWCWHDHIRLCVFCTLCRERPQIHWLDPRPFVSPVP